MATDTQVPANEQAILQNLETIRSELGALKRDRSTFLKSTDIWEIYGRLKTEIAKLLEVRRNPEQEDEVNRVDTVLDDVFQLMSLAFLTVGITNKTPATFASLATVKRLLDHLDETTTYTDNDVKSIRERLADIQRIVDQDAQENGESSEIVQYTKKKISLCFAVLKKVEASLKRIDPALNKVFQRLVYLRREIMAIGSKPSFSPSAFKPLLDELRKIEGERVDGHFVDENGRRIEDGESIINAIIEKCHSLIQDFSVQEDHVAPTLKPIYSRLVEMKNTLEGLLVTHRWTLRETDLYSYYKELQTIETYRHNGVIRTEQDPPDSVPKGQSILLYLIRRCYAMIYRLLECSEPVSEALAPIHNQLSTTRRCLMEVKKMGGLSSVRELYPYQMKLASIDNMRVEGKFMVGDTIPEGQGMLNALLSECFDLCYELKVEMEEQQNQSDDPIQLSKA